MKIVVALDKFKGSISAADACDSVKRGLLAARSDLRIILKPMADGGDGTAEVLKIALGGRWIQRNVTGPLPTMRVGARYLWLPKDRLAVIEMASASGLALLKPEQRNPLLTTTYGTGELIADAMQRGAKRILLGVGGSATVDGGVGAAMAFGWKFLDATGRPIGLGGGELERIAKIIPPRRRRWPVMEVLCDVDNPLCGRHGAARVFGPQKGATPAMVARLDAGLCRLARLANIRNVPGTGAAGGLSAGAVAFMGARLVPGAEMIMEFIGLEDAFDGADVVITGEGCFDEQSLRGKVVSGILKLAQAKNVRVIVLAGAVRLSRAQWRRAGVETALAIQPPGMSTAEAMRRAGELLRKAVQEVLTLRGHL
jgi:glycerate 2-kinase